jgi:maltose O-acetyltransferase
VSRNLRVELLYRLTSSSMFLHRLRPRLLRAAGEDVADSAGIMHGLRIGTPHLSRGQIRVAPDASINLDCFIENAASVTIEEGVQIASHVRILTATHEIGGPDGRAGKEIIAPVTIGRGTWIGSGVTILPGVSVGPGCVIGAGSIVTEDCQPNGMYVGVPARRVKDLPTA